MLTRRDAVVLGLGVAASRLGYSKDFWLEKKPEEWSEKDIEKLLTHSPWAKEITAEMTMSGGGMGRGGRGGMSGMPSADSSASMGGGDVSTMGSGGGGGGGGMGGGGGRRGGGGGGGMEPPMMPQIKAQVRWETAAPVRAAAKSALPKEVAEHYAITLASPGLTAMLSGGGNGAGRGGGRPDAPENADPEARRKALLQRIAQNTALQRKGKDPLHPEHVLTGKDPARMFVMFLFPRDAQPITLEDKDVTFVCKLGPAEFKAKFTLKDMVVDGKLEV